MSDFHRIICKILRRSYHWHKFRRNFQCLSPIRTCNTGIEDNAYFFLHCSSLGSFHLAPFTGLLSLGSLGWSLVLWLRALFTAGFVGSFKTRWFATSVFFVSGPGLSSLLTIVSLVLHTRNILTQASPVHNFLRQFTYSKLVHANTCQTMLLKHGASRTNVPHFSACYCVVLLVPCFSNVGPSECDGAMIHRCSNSESISFCLVVLKQIFESLITIIHIENQFLVENFSLSLL